MTQQKNRYVVFARPRDQLIVEDFQNIASLTTMELVNYLKANDKEEFLAIHTPYYLEALDASSHPFEDYKNVIRDSKPESKYFRPDYYIAILPFNEYSTKEFTIYIDVEILNPTKDQNEEKELVIPPFPTSFLTSDITSYSDLRQVIMKNFPFAIKVDETPKFSINIPKDTGNDDEFYEFDLSDECTGNYPRPNIETFFDSYLHNNRIKVSCIIEDKALTKIRHRVSIIKEIKTTEQTFISGLHYLIDYYQDKLKANKMLSFEEDQKVFKNVPLIITAHEALLERLDEAQQTYASNLSSVFIDFSNYFKVSKLFISQYSAIIQMFLEKKKDKEFARKFQEISKGHTELNSLLITPVQRMPRYILFLRELIKYTPPSHPDSSLLKTAEKLLQEVTFDIEKASTEAENQALTSTIQDKIGKDQIILIKPDRVCLLTMKINFVKPKLGPGYVYMFNDLVLIITEKAISDIDTNCQIILAQTPIEFKYSIPSIDQMTFIIDSNPISQAVASGLPMSTSNFYENDDDSNETLDKKSKKSKKEKKEEEKREKEKKKEEEKREREKKKQRVAIIEFEVRDEKEQFIEQLYKAKSKFFNTGDDKKNIFRFVPLNLKAMNEASLFISDSDGAYIPEQQLLYIFGGSPLNNNLLIINVFNGSVICRPTKIPARMNHTVSFYSKPGAEEGKDKYLLIFGGKGEGNEALNDLWYINLKNYDDFGEIDVKLKPENRYGHTAVACNDRFYVFGGMNKKKVFNDLCSIGIQDFDKKWVWQTQQATEMFPSPRAFHSSALVGNKWYIFGGVNDKKASVFTTKVPDEPDTLHCLDFRSNFWESFELPFVSNRAWHRMVSVGSYIILLGGMREVELEPIIVYDTLFKTARSFRAGFNEPQFLTCFYATFVNPYLNETKTAGLTPVSEPKSENTQEIKRTSQPHLLVFGGLNPITKEYACGLYEVKIPTLILDRIKSESAKNAPQPLARMKDSKKLRKPDSIPIGSTPSLDVDNENDDEQILIMRRSITTLNANTVQEIKKRLNKVDVPNQTNTQTESLSKEPQIDATSTNASEIAEKLNESIESSEASKEKTSAKLSRLNSSSQAISKPPIPVPPQNNANNSDTSKTSSISAMADKLGGVLSPKYGSNGSEQAKEKATAKNEQPKKEQPMLPQPSLSAPIPQSPAILQQPASNPATPVSSGIAARLAMFNNAGPIAFKNQPVSHSLTPQRKPETNTNQSITPSQLPSSNPFNTITSNQATQPSSFPKSQQPQNQFQKANQEPAKTSNQQSESSEQAPAPASDSIDSSDSFDEEGFCNSLGIDASGLVKYQKVALMNKLKVLHTLKTENQAIESQIETSNKSISNSSPKNSSLIFGKVIVKKKYVKIIMIDPDSTISQVRSQIQSDCPNTITDSLKMFVTNKPLSSVPLTSIKETTAEEFSTILNMGNSSHLNFCFQ